MPNYGDSAPNYCEFRLDDEPPPAFHLAAAFDFRRHLVLDGTHAEYDRIDALKLSRCSVRSKVGEFCLTSHRAVAVARMLSL
jgi:hypothetical protein